MRKFLVLLIGLILICAMGCFAMAASYTWPVPTDVDVNWDYLYGARTQSGSTHTGTDFPCPIGTPVYAVASGTVDIYETGCQGSHNSDGIQNGYGCPNGSACEAVTNFGSTGSYGNFVIIHQDDGVDTYYCHMKSGSWAVGDYQHVEQGQLIGYSGVAGNTTGPHLHFEVRINGSTYDPLNYIDQVNVSANRSPVMDLNDAQGKIGGVYVKGWAFDPDAPSATLTMHIYVQELNGGQYFAGELQANKYRPDVNNVYGTGDYHGFEGMIYTKGCNNKFIIQVAALDTAGGNATWKESGYEQITWDGTPPEITSVSIDSITKTSFRAIANVKDNVVVTRVAFPTWRYSQGGNSAKWWEGRNTSGNQWTASISRGTEEKWYYGHVYAYDYQGNEKSVGTIAHGNLKVTFNANGGTCSTGNKEVYAAWYNDTAFQTYGSLPSATRTGYNFDGWYTAASGGTKITSESKVTTYGDHTLYAHWTAKKYYLDVNAWIDGTLWNSPTKDHLTFDLKVNGTTVVTGVSDYRAAFNYGASYEVCNIKPAARYRLDGVGANSQPIKGTIPANDFQVNPKLTTISYTLTYDANAGSDSVSHKPGNQEKTYGVNLTLSNVSPTRNGYTFLWWNTKADGSGSRFYPGESYTANAAMTLYAIWGKDGSEMTSGAGQSLPNGDYMIYASENRANDFGLDIDGHEVPAAENANVQLSTISEDEDAWTLTYLNNGYYSILQKGTNMALTVQNGSVKWRGNVQVNAYTGSTSQQWSIEETYTGTTRKGMCIKARCSGLSLDMMHGPKAMFSNIFQFQGDASADESWVFVPYKPAQTIEDRRYILLSNLGDEWLLDVKGDTGDIPNGQNVHIWSDLEEKFATEQLSRYSAFDVEYLGDGYYKLIQTVSGKALSVSSASTVYSENVCVSDYTDALNQQWAIIREGDVYVLMNRYSGYGLDVQGAIAENGRNVMQYRYGGAGNKHQLWKFVPAEYTIGYDANGGTGAPDSQNKYYKGDLTLSDAVPVRANNTFMGWRDDRGGIYQPGDVYTLDADMTLTAQWREKTRMTLPEALVEIGEQAFAECGAAIIVISNGCESIGSEAFLNCASLEEIYIPASVTYISFDAFDGCDNLTIHAPEGSVAARMAVRLGIEWVND